MPNPVFTDLTKDVFTKVATNVTTGQVHKINTTPVYVQTYKLTGEGAPANTRALGVPMFEQAITELISSSAAIDVYIMPVGVAGRIRVDV